MVGRGLLDTSVLIADDIGPLPGQPAPQRRPAPSASLPEPPPAHLTPVPVEDAVADSYGQIAAHVAAAGRQPRARAMDLLIAATAHVHAAVLDTRNADDFRGLESFIRVVPV